MVDVGTDNEDLLADPIYVGERHPRIRGEEYDAFMETVLAGFERRWPGVVIQFEDFAQPNATPLLRRYREKFCCFNDDIQGTGAVALAGVISACRIKKESLKDQRFVIHGAGAGGIGVAWAITEGLKREGLSADEARARVFVLDSRGLLLEGRSMDAYKQPYAQSAQRVADWRFAGPT